LSPSPFARGRAEKMASNDTTSDRLSVLRKAYMDAADDLEAARKAKTWHALARMRSQVLEIHEQIASLEAAAAEVHDDLTPEELEAELVDALREMPRDMAQRLMDQAHPPPGLRVVSGAD
jgi:ATP-dependent Clp protease adapter protein ClpS